jgi:hypothetical protein
MTDKTLEQKNREVCQWLGKCWHEFKDNKWIGAKCVHCGIAKANPKGTTNPNYICHPKELLRELVKREDWNRLKNQRWIAQGAAVDYIQIDYITDQTGKLLDAVWQWMKEER